MGAGGTFDAEKAGGATSPKQSENLLSIFRFLAVQALNSGPDRDHYPGPCLQAVKGRFGLYMSPKIRE